MKIVLFGAGQKFCRFLKKCKSLEYIDIVAVLDNDEKKWGLNICGYVISAPELLRTITYDKIAITAYYEEIRDQLINLYNIDAFQIIRADYMIVPAMVNLGSVKLDCDYDKLQLIPDLVPNSVIANNKLEQFFFFKEHRVINKWWHYFEIYNEYFEKFIGREVKILEIGIYKGGSLQMWKDYFGEKASIVGIDIDSQCKQYEEERIHICIGSQDDSKFLEEVYAEFGPFDVVVDDGSHIMEHQIKSFEILFPLLKENGVYVCEDTHTSYWSRFGGALHQRNTWIEYSKGIVDEMNYCHIDQDDELFLQFRGMIRGIHFYDSMVVVEKRKTGWPIWSMEGNEEGGI